MKILKLKVVESTIFDGKLSIRLHDGSTDLRGGLKEAGFEVGDEVVLVRASDLVPNPPLTMDPYLRHIGPKGGSK